MYVFLSPQATRGVDDDSVKVQKITIILHKVISTNVNKKEKWQCVKIVISTL